MLQLLPALHRAYPSRDDDESQCPPSARVPAAFAVDRVAVRERSMRQRRRKPGERPTRPEPIGNAVQAFLSGAGLTERVEQAKIVPEWPSLVGAQIASVTAPQAIAADGTLLVAVTTNAWMTELSLMEPELLRTLNRLSGRSRIRKIRWLLQR